ncbi:amidase [Prodigiosinella confusarubida]|nr:amidase [Serratia sp. ATCC 39006]
MNKYANDIVTQMSRGNVDACQLAAFFRTGTLSPSSLAEKLLSAAAQVPEMFIALTPERARKEAAASTLRWKQGQPLSTLDGVPVAWKDLFDVKGTITTAGSATRLAIPPAEEDASLVKQLSQAGLVTIGKTNLSEFAFSGLGLNPHFGTPSILDNQNLRHAPGGSSSGSALAVAAGIVPLAMGTDTAGSIRIPAAFNGLIGFRSSRHRYAISGVFPLAASLDTLGPLCRSVRDALALDAILCPRQYQTPCQTTTPLTLRVDSTLLNAADTEPAVRENLYLSLDKLATTGVTIDLRPVTALHEALAWIADRGWPGAREAYLLHKQRLDSPAADLMDPRVRTRLLGARHLSPEMVSDFLQCRSDWQKNMAEELGNSLLVTPTVSHTAPTLLPLETDNELFARTNFTTLRLTMPGSLLDMPGITLPTGKDQRGLATSMLLSLPSRQDSRLLLAARDIEQALGLSPIIPYPHSGDITTVIPSYLQ